MGLIWARSLPIQLTLLFLWKPFRLRTCILRFWSSIFPLRMSIPSQIREKGSRFNCSLAVIPTLYRVRKDKKKHMFYTTHLLIQMIKHIAADILKDPNFVSEFVQNLSPPSLVVSSSTPTAVQFSTPFVDALVPAPFNPVPDLPPSWSVKGILQKYQDVQELRGELHSVQVLEKKRADDFSRICAQGSIQGP
ncbi:hypothetical protein CUMW_242760 [Citrus unshiu]|uniref:Uncharacterized protein n=1 Tax=Citrus unshiu TaxID=55188 RepID=A0A2H5QLZ6_CITUN|nr:hypothetical protein CUMW_242760 [Citrus unshiu]